MATLYFHGLPVDTVGELPAVDSQAPDFVLTGTDLRDVSLASFGTQKKLLVIVPSVDTPVCAAMARRFNQKAAQLPDTPVLLISEDLPFALCRFGTVENLTDLVLLSGFRSDFADVYGVRLANSLLSGLTARAVVILDEQNRVIYSAWVAELTDEPDYDAALVALSTSRP